MCGEKIGSKDKTHQISRNELGARRIMHPAFVDITVYRVWSMKDL